MPLLATSMPPIKQEMIDHLRGVFQPVHPVPNITTMDEIMHSTGHQEVIEYLTKFIQQTTVTGRAL